MVCTSGNLPHLWRMWKLSSVREILKRDYQLRPVAIEIFSMDGCNDLLVFHKKEREEVFKNLVAMNLPRNSMNEECQVCSSLASDLESKNKQENELATAAANLAPSSPAENGRSAMSLKSPKHRRTRSGSSSASSTPTPEKHVRGFSRFFSSKGGIRR